MDLLWHLLLGGFAGFLAGKVMNGKGFGILGDIILGLVGGFVGGWLGDLTGIHFAWFITAFLGAVLLVWLSRLLSK